MHRTKGFTLIELMIALAIIGILAAIAYPSYTESIFKSRRADAKAALMQAELEQQKRRASGLTYQAQASTTSPDGHYTVAIALTTVAGVVTGYVATATPAGQQVGDSCGNFRITVTSTGTTYTSTSGAASACWGQ